MASKMCADIVLKGIWVSKQIIVICFFLGVDDADDATICNWETWWLMRNGEINMDIKSIMIGFDTLEPRWYEGWIIYTEVCARVTHQNRWHELVDADFDRGCISTYLYRWPRDLRTRFLSEWWPYTTIYAVLSYRVAVHKLNQVS